MSRFNFGSNKAALFFAMALLPSGIVYSQTKKDTVQKERKIEEVIVIGYGTQKKEAVTGSVSSLSGSALKEVPAANITEALQGRLPGVEISQISTKPGAEQQIRIRGTRSLSADNNPLIVLDGIPFAGSISDINPNDIKSLDVLKDASATAIYGSRGANGVIIVTTNRGNKNQKARFSYNGYMGVQTLFSKYPMMDGAKLQKLRQDANNLYTIGGNEEAGMNTDWQDLYYGTGTITSHDVGVTGGTNGGGYSAGIAYFKQEGVVPLQYYQRLSMRMSLDQQVGELFKFGFTSNNNFSTNNANGLNAGNVLQFSPLINPYNNGTPRTVISTISDQMWAYTRQNLESLGDAYIDRTKSFGSYNNLYGEFNFPGIQGLKYRLNVGLNYKNSNGGAYTGVGVFNTNPAAVSSASISNSSNIQWVLENLLTYDRTFGKHKINAIALYSAEQQTYNSSYIKATDVPIDAFQFYNLGQAQGEITIDPNYQSYYKRGLMSWMGRVMYQYDNRYMLTATVRSDGASVLAPGHKWHTYPAVSVGWNATNESFLNGIKNVDLIKFRAGYGQTSNQSVGPYSTLGRLTTLPYNFGSSNAIGNYVTTLPNSDLGWEYSKTQNYGVDFGFFGNRLTGTVEYYKTETKDILLAKNLPYTSGVSSVVTNIGATENKGIEISLNGTIFSTENFSWDVGVNWYKNRNKIVALNSGQERDEANLWFVGHNINSLYDYQYVGLWQNGDPYLQVLEPGGNVGMIKVLYTGGYKADGTPERAIGVQDRQIIDTDPDWQGGFSSKWRYKNFDLSVVGAYQHGGVLISTLYGSSSYLNMLNGRRGQIDVDYWTEENPNVRYPKPGGISTNDNPKYSSTLGYFDGSYLKIRTITLGYNFNKNLLETLKITNLRLYATVTNPFVLFSPYYKESGMDPEPNSRGDENQAVTTSYKNRFPVVGATNPSTRNFLLGINLTF